MSLTSQVNRRYSTFDHKFQKGDVSVKLTAKARYAVAALADIAAFGGEAPVSAKDIAARQVISQTFLDQLFRKLRAAGLVESHRGAGGGYRLNVAPAEIRITDIVRAVDEPVQTTACVPGEQLGCRGTAARCLTHDLWDELGRHIEIFLASVTLADVVERQVLGLAGRPADQREVLQ